MNNNDWKIENEILTHAPNNEKCGYCRKTKEGYECVKCKEQAPKDIVLFADLCYCRTPYLSIMLDEKMEELEKAFLKENTSLFARMIRDMVGK